MSALGVFILLFIIAFLFFWERALWLWYAFVFLGPFTGLILNFNQLSWAKDLPYIGNINAPYVDFLALFLLILVGARIATRVLKGSFTPFAELRAIGWYFFLPFLFVAFISIIQVDPEVRANAFKYFLRPILFFYLVWIVLPSWIITSKRVLKNSIVLFLSTGIIAALMGLFSLFFKEAAFGFLTRVTPLGWGSFYPFGWNQNLLAEVLVAAIPLAAYCMWRTERVAARKWYFVSFILMLAAALLTFSRAAWIALIIEGAIYMFFYKKISRVAFLRIVGATLVVISPLVVYMAVFIRSPIVISSNATRFDITGIAWSAFKAHPLLGNGVGSFVPLVEETRVFGVEYGDPLDAHGVFQKLIAEVGLFGTLAFIVFVWWCVARLWKAWVLRDPRSASRAMLFCLFLSASGSFVFQLFNTSYYGVHLWLPVGLALAAARLFESSSL
ncbi:O-antigen ligase family protein [Candidatus Azambacteria bacterium]|nr:O-antigen ligase family protein [Candidatus Azambacteria bacterium]